MLVAGFVIAPAALGERRAHMRRNWSDDADRRAIFIERNDDFPRMQMQDRAAFARRCPIDGVAADGPTHCGAMDAKLMRASGQRFECEPSECLTLPWRGRVTALCLRSKRRHHPHPTCLRQVDVPPPKGGQCAPPYHLPFRHRRLSGGIVFHPPAANDIKPPEWQFDLPILTVGAAFDHRPIRFAYCS